MLVVTRSPLVTYFATFLVMTVFLLLTVLLSETGNSLVNPVEGLVLAHQPVNGATYTAAKLTHLARIILCMVPGLNLIPAFLGLSLKEAGWSYPPFICLPRSRWDWWRPRSYLVSVPYRPTT